MAVRASLARVGWPTALLLLVLKVLCACEVAGGNGDLFTGNGDQKQQELSTRQVTPAQTLREKDHASVNSPKTILTTRQSTGGGTGSRFAEPPPCILTGSDRQACLGTEYSTLVAIRNSTKTDPPVELQRISQGTGSFISSGMKHWVAHLEQVFAPSCPFHWHGLAYVVPSLTVQVHGQDTKENQSGGITGQELLSLDSAAKNNFSLTPHELRMYAQPAVLTRGKATEVFAEIVDAEGHLYPTDCGSVSLYLLQQDAAAAELFLSGLGHQLLKGGIAKWSLTFEGLTDSPYMTLEAIPRLCTQSSAENFPLLDNLPVGQLLPPSRFLIPLKDLGEAFPSYSQDSENAFRGELQTLGNSRPVQPISANVVIATVDLQSTSSTEEEVKSLHQCGNSLVDNGASRDILPSSAKPEIEPNKSQGNCDGCSHKLHYNVGPRGRLSSTDLQTDICTPLRLVFNSWTAAVTIEHPHFGYFVHLSRPSHTPVAVSIFPRLSSASLARLRGAPIPSFVRSPSGEPLKEDELVFLVGGEPQAGGHRVVFKPDEWNQPIAIEIELPLTVAAAAAALVATGDAPLELHIEHVLSPLGIEASSAEMQLAARENVYPSMPPTVSVQCKVHTYFDDATSREDHWGEVGAHKQFNRPISVRCHLHRSAGVRGDVRVTVSAGKSLRLVSPAPGTDLILLESSDNPLEDAGDTDGGAAAPLEEPCQEERCKSQNGPNPTRGSNLAWASAEVMALVIPEDSGCTNSSCTLSFDLGPRDRINGGDLQLLPLGGKVAVFPESHPSEGVIKLSQERGRIQMQLVRPWSLMPRNEAKAELIVMGGPATVEEVVSRCFTASCNRADKYPISASVRCEPSTGSGTTYSTLYAVDVYVSLTPAVSANCQLFDPTGTSTGTLQVVPTSNSLCGEATFYSRDSGACEPCPKGFKCYFGRLLQCATSREDKCTLCPEGKEASHWCPTGYYLVGGACERCPQGFACKDGVAMPCKQGELGSTSMLLRNECTKCPAGHLCPNPRADPIACPSGLVDADSLCRPCPAGVSCENGKMTACERFFSYSLPGDLRCRPCPPGHECLDPGQPPAACQDGEVILEGTKGGVMDRRCSPCPPHSICPSPLHILPLSEGFERDPETPMVERPIDTCHTHYTDPKCPEGGICWGGKYFACPQ
ncbi:uncharacterized protein LOC34620724 [Cyclospora cayetanensis]|uniref:Uncharacterized protein LOC34620724 n=1 Tax=Cyclospora cayetanensis TaxID=88456 RepID=A0A6P6RRR7_9EIME|nr:uncharacterized protein LOC34620724 [Cyclospora cayetanensis]